MCSSNIKYLAFINVTTFKFLNEEKKYHKKLCITLGQRETKETDLRFAITARIPVLNFFFVVAGIVCLALVMRSV